MTTITDDALLAQVNEIFQDVFEDPSLHVAPSLAREDDPRWDPMNHLNIVMQSEIMFGIKFGVADIEGIQTVGDLLAVIAKKTR